jgi:hypothetical protein
MQNIKCSVILVDIGATGTETKELRTISGKHSVDSCGVGTPYIRKSITMKLK